jgi:hypothetical protein
MLNARLGLSLGLLALFATSCGALPGTVNINIVQPTQEDVGQIVQATFQAMTAQAVGKPASTPIPPTSAASTASISGTLNYPAESLPALYVVAYQVGTQNYQYVITAADQSTYKIDGLPPGTYHVVAYTVGGGGFPAGLAGGYTKAVPCGLMVNCTDHSLIDVTVFAGQTGTDVIPSDWLAPAGAFPPFPQQAAAPTSAATLPPAVADGTIAGDLMYPASGIPALRIVAFRVGSSAYYFVDTALGESTYKLQHVPPGTYHVVAYTLAGGGFTAGLPGGYSQMVPCGLKYGCNDHTLIDVVVTAGGTALGVDPNDYYADAGTFPPNPAP